MKNPILEYFRKRAQKKAEKLKRIEAKINEVFEDYEQLLKEYALIEEKKSTLSKKERDFVVTRVMYLISKGHIKVIPNEK